VLGQAAFCTAIQACDLQAIEYNNNLQQQQQEQEQEQEQEQVEGQQSIANANANANANRNEREQERERDQWVCLKIIKYGKDYFDQSLDEIKLLQYINTHATLASESAVNDNGNGNGSTNRNSNSNSNSNNNSYAAADKYNVLRLIDYFYYKEHIYIVTELLRDNLYEFQKAIKDSGQKPYFVLPRIKLITKQILIALKFIHELGLLVSTPYVF
jgi:serine/threonine protein kinase